MSDLRRPSRFLPVLTALVGIALVCCLGAGAKTLDGGGTVSGAPQLPLGTPATGGASLDDNCCESWYQHENTAGTQYWKVLLQFGDHLVIDYGVVSGDNVNLCMLQPSVTDYTLSDSSCAANDSTETKHEFNFVAPAAGTWTLVVGDFHCCSTISWAYQLTAYVKHLTRTTLTAPAIVKHGAAVTYHGAVSGTTSGQVELESRSLARPVWKPFAAATIGANGSFSFKTKIAGTGTYRIKAIYPGDSSHLPSSTLVSFKVI